MIYALLKNNLGAMLYLYAIPYLGWYLGMLKKQTVICINAMYALSEELSDYYEDRCEAKKRIGPLVPACSINRMTSPVYVPPKIEERRAGCFDFKSWPSRGED